MGDIKKHQVKLWISLNTCEFRTIVVFLNGLLGLVDKLNMGQGGEKRHKIKIVWVYYPSNNAKYTEPFQQQQLQQFW